MSFVTCLVVILLGTAMDLYLRISFSCRFVVPVIYLDAFETLCAYVIISIVTVVRILLDPNALQRFRSHTLVGFAPRFFPSCICGLLCFALPHCRFLRAIREVDLSVIAVVLPLHFVLCAIVEFKALETTFLVLVVSGAAAMIASVEFADYALPDLGDLFDLLLVQFSWSLGFVVHKKTLRSCDTCLTLLLEMAVGLVVSLVRLFFQLSWDELVEMSLALSNDFLHRVMCLSLIVKPCLCLGICFALNFCDLSVFGAASLIPLFLESTQTRFAMFGLGLVLLGVFLSPGLKRSNGYSQLTTYTSDLAA
jgi:hypothetical protein